MKTSTSNHTKTYIRDYWFDEICKTYVPVSCDSDYLASNMSFDALIDVKQFSELQISNHINSLPMRYSRNKTDIRNSDHEYALLFFLNSGEAIVQQNGNESHLEAGDLIMYDSTKPYLIDYKTSHHTHALKIRKDKISSLIPHVDHLMGIKVSGKNQLVKLSRAIVRESLDLDINECSGHESAIVEQTVIDIIASAFNLHSNTNLDKHQEHLGRIKKYIIENLHDPELDINKICISNNISSRTLNRIFSTDGTTVIKWMWQQRLQLAYKRIRSGHAQQISTISYDLGFKDPSHFSRAFKKMFGLAPINILENKQIN